MPLTPGQYVLRKLPHITALFWAIKILATTLGETAGDYFSQTLGLGTRRDTGAGHPPASREASESLSAHGWLTPHRGYSADVPVPGWVSGCPADSSVSSDGLVSTMRTRSFGCEASQARPGRSIRDREDCHRSL